MCPAAGTTALVPNAVLERETLVGVLIMRVKCHLDDSTTDRFVGLKLRELFSLHSSSRQAVAAQFEWSASQTESTVCSAGLALTGT